MEETETLPPSIEHILESVKPTKYLVCMDGSDESKTALRLACLKAKKRGGRVEMLHVIPPSEFQTLLTVADRMNEEQREEAEKLMQEAAETVLAETGLHPSISIRNGKIGECIVSAVEEAGDVTVLVVGVAEEGRGTLVAWLASNLGSKLQTPMLLVPGNLTNQQIQKLI